MSTYEFVALLLVVIGPVLALAKATGAPPSLVLFGVGLASTAVPGLPPLRVDPQLVLNLFLPPQDVLWSFLKVAVFAVVIILSHCYYGYRASGGPAGVGLAVGRAVRFSIVAVMVIDLFLSLAIWGSTTTVRIAG